MHYEEVRGFFFVLSGKGEGVGGETSCEWDHSVGGNFGPRCRALVGQAFLLTCLFPPLAPSFLTPTPSPLVLHRHFFPIQAFIVVSMTTYVMGCGSRDLF